MGHISIAISAGGFGLLWWHVQ